MNKINIHEAKTHLSRYLELVVNGETILLCKRNVPVAEIRPIPIKPRAKRPIGLAEGNFEIPPAFYEPLPDDVINSFYGGES